MRNIKPPKLTPMKLSGRDGILVQTPYDEIFVGQLKNMISRRDRWWNEHRKGWWVAEEERTLVMHLLEMFGGTVVIVDQDGHEVIHEHGETLEQGRLL